ncbi:MAG: hypothetical protein HQL54_11580 [Magnetococcales bacterium]|nr:hypothetical protein [Magnetococcales bacterium]
MSESSTQISDVVGAWPERIYKLDSAMDLFVVEDSNKQNIAYCSNEKMARFVFAAPGLLTAMESLVETIKPLADMAVNWDPKVGEKAIQALADAESSILAAIQMDIEQD